MSEGDFWVTPEQLGQPISLTGENGQSLKIAAGNYGLKLNMAELTLVITSNGIAGDLNNDSVVDVDDLNLIINMMLGKVEKDNIADLNKDGAIDVGDLNIVINIMLGKN